MNTFAAVMFANFLACLVTTVGIFVINRHEKWGNRNIVYFMSFAAGVLVSVSLLHIIPKALAMHTQAPIFILVGFFGMHLTNRFINIYVCQKHDCTDLSIGIIPMIGIGLHSLIDGVIYSVTFHVSVFTGTVTAIGMVLHEFPEGIVTFLLLEKAGFARKKAVIWAFLAAALSTPVGALISFPFIKKIGKPTLGVLLAISAGALVYVGATHLLPAVEQEKKRNTLASLLAGILIAVFIILTKG